MYRVQHLREALRELPRALAANVGCGSSKGSDSGCSSKGSDSGSGVMGAPEHVYDELQLYAHYMAAQTKDDGIAGVDDDDDEPIHEYTRLCFSQEQQAKLDGYLRRKQSATKLQAAKDKHKEAESPYDSANHLDAEPTKLPPRAQAPEALAAMTPVRLRTPKKKR